MTVDKKISAKISLQKIASMEHSPLRCMMYWVELRDIPTFVSVHFVRHKIGVEHFVTSKRDDRRVDPEEVVDRMTPVNHGMLINAHALIQIARKRLCPASHRKTVHVWRKLKKAVAVHHPEVAMHMVPECVYRNGICPEYKECAAGVKGMMKAYSDYPLTAAVEVITIK